MARRYQRNGALAWLGLGALAAAAAGAAYVLLRNKANVEKVAAAQAAKAAPVAIEGGVKPLYAPPLDLPCPPGFWRTATSGGKCVPHIMEDNPTVMR